MDPESSHLEDGTESPRSARVTRLASQLAQLTTLLQPVLAAFAIDVAQPIASVSPTHPSLAPRVHRQKVVDFVDTESKFNCGKEPGHRKAECAKFGGKTDLEDLNGKRPAKN